MPNGSWILGDLFTKDYGHRGSIAKLWENRWKAPCQRSVYPFHDGSFEDFEPIFQHLIANDINDPYSDDYTNAFLPTARELVKKAEGLSELGASSKVEHKEEAKTLYLRANAVFRLARFPYLATPLKKHVFEEQKAAYMAGTLLWDIPMHEVTIPHTHASNGDDPSIPLYIRHPPGPGPFPTILLITGLDGHRPDNTERTEAHLRRGWATLICDIPGTTRDCPANRHDPLSPDRLFSTILSWIAQNRLLDASRIVAWGLSAGGYYAIRLAHTHAAQLRGCVGHGAGTHHYIGAEWLARIDLHEYPFGLERAYCLKYGFEDFRTLQEQCQDKFSLVTGKGEGVAVVASGIRSSRLLLVNGALDGCMPAEDSLLLAEYGRPKDIRLIRDRAHMGYPEANGVVFEWMEEVIASKTG